MCRNEDCDPLRFEKLYLKKMRFCGFSLVLCLVKIALTWRKPASTMFEVGNASKIGSSVALSLGY